MDYSEWLQIGLENSWCGPVVCSTHDGTPTTEVEEDNFYSGDDPCIWIVRLYEGPMERQLVEANHSPSLWRRGFGG